MQNLNFQRFLTLVFCLFIAAQSAFADGIIRGKIIDNNSGEPLLFANIIIKDSNPVVGAQTNFDGDFELKVAAGTHTLEASYLGYSNKIIQGVEVKEGEVTVIDIIMEEASAVMEEIVVVATSIDRTETAMLAVQRKALSIQDGISAQEISRYGSGNAAGALKRVTGASVVGGKYIYVRGLGDRYSSAQLNGQPMPSNDPYRNSTQLDVIPANLLDNVVASKTFTADQPGNFTGGNVNVKTKSFPESFTLSASLSATYNTNSSFNDNFLSYNGGSTDWLGFDDGNRAPSAALLDPEVQELLQKNYGGSQGIRNTLRNDPALAAKFDEAMKSLNSEMAPTPKSTALDHGVSFSVGNQIKLAGKPLGFIFGANYKKSYDAYENADLNFYQISVSNPDVFTTVYNFQESKGTENPAVSALSSLSYKFGKNNTNKIAFNFLYNHDATKTARYVKGHFPVKVASNSEFQSRILYWNERQFASTQLSGEHLLSEELAIKLNWGLGYINATQDEPDTRVFENTFRIKDTGEEVYGIDPAEFQMPFHFYRDLKDQQGLAKLDIEIPFLREQSKGNKIKVGYLGSQKDREFNNSLFQFSENGNFEAYNGDEDVFFGEGNVGVIDHKENGDPIIGQYVENQERATLKNNYTGQEEIHAAYAMASYDINKWRIVAGARMETTNIQVASADTSFQTGNISATDILPSLNVIYRISDKMNVRLCGSQTLARPNMRELAPFSSFDRGTDFRLTGNPDLERTLIQNYDFRWEWYTKPGELLAVSVYHKRFQNPIIKAFDIKAANREIRYQNTDEATVSGIEFEFRKKLDFIGGGVFQNLRFISNLSLIQSEVAIPGSKDDINTEAGQIAAYNPSKGYTRPFQGQSPYLVNVGLNYANPEKGVDIILSYNVYGKRLTLNNQGADPDFFEQPRPQLDFAFKKIFNERYGFKFFVRNILDSPYKETLDYSGSQEYIIQQYNRGMDVGVTISYNIK